MISFELGVIVDEALQRFGNNYNIAINDVERLRTDRAVEDFLKDFCGQHPGIDYDTEMKFYLGITGREQEAKK